MNTCPICHTLAPDGADECPQCGATLRDEAPSLEREPGGLGVSGSGATAGRTRGKGGFVRFCLTVAIAVSFANCFLIPLFGLWFFQLLSERHQNNSTLVAGIVLGIPLLPVAFCMAVAQLAVFSKVRSLCDLEAPSSYVKPE